MDPLLRDQIEGLRRSPDQRDRAQATVLEVLVEVREQTTKTNGRVTRLETSCTDHAGRIRALETPAKKFAILWGAALSFGSAMVVVLGLMLAFLATPLGDAWVQALGDKQTAEHVADAVREDRVHVDRR